MLHLLLAILFDVFVLIVSAIVVIVAVIVIISLMQSEVTEEDFLAALNTNWQAGYEIAESIDRAKGVPKKGLKNLRGAGLSTTFRALEKLQKKGWVERTESLQMGRLRGQFRLTEAGLKEQARISLKSATNASG